MDKYVNARKQLYTEKLRALLPSLPSFCTDFFISIDSSTTVLTRYNYALDLRIFFTYLTDEGMLFPGKTPSEIDLDDMDKITTSDVERFLAYLGSYNSPLAKLHREDNLSAKARKYSAIRSLFKYLYKNEKIKQNVTTRISAPKIPEKAIVRLDEDEVSDVYDALASTGNFISERQNNYNANNTQIRDNAIVSLLLGTGIRVSECVGLNVNDLNFRDMTFLVTRKGGKQAILYFNEEIAADLDLYLKFREEQLVSKKIDPATVDALFLSTQMRRISVRAVEIMVKKYTEVATPLKNITPHKFRSTYGTALYRATKDIYVVAEVLGHSDVNTTKKHYAASDDDIRKEASKKVNFRKKTSDDDE